jgi:hypothetical protein
MGQSMLKMALDFPEVTKVNREIFRTCDETTRSNLNPNRRNLTSFSGKVFFLFASVSILI